MIRSLLVGVCHNENALSYLRYTKGASWKPKRDGVVTQGFQVAENHIEVKALDVSNVLSHNPSRGDFFHNPAHLWPEVAIIGFVLSGAAGWSCVAEGLARKSSANNVNWAEVVLAAISDVAMTVDGGPMF